MLHHGRPIKLKREISILQTHRPINRAKIDASHASGFVLPMVIAGGLILMIGAIILSMRGFSSLTGSIRQGQRSQAEEIAESGANAIIQELNQNFPYLLVENCEVTNNSTSEQMNPPECDAGWGSYDLNNMYPSTVCSQRSQYPEEIMDDLYLPSPEGKGFYRLRSYEFFGDQIQGGTAVIEVQGQLRHGPADNPKIASSAVLRKEITIVPKCCDKAPYTTCTKSTGWKYGLTADDISLNRGDVIDLDPNVDISGAIVNCNNCTDPPQPSPNIEAKCKQWDSDDSSIQNMTDISESKCQELLDDNYTDQEIAEMDIGLISGKRSNDQVEIPDAPTWNPAWKKNGQEMPAKSYVNQNVTFTHHTQEGAHPDTDKSCYTEIMGTKKITHCRIGNLTYSDYSKLTIKPGENGEIRFYVEGKKIALSGKQFIIPDDVGFEQFAIFGSKSLEKFSFSGEGKVRALLYMPQTLVAFSGGRFCDYNGVDYSLALEGIAIVKEWQNSTYADCAQIRVPTDAGTKVCESYGLCSTTASNSNQDMEYVAIGTNRWDFVQMDR